jgi:hypothetical protein
MNRYIRNYVLSPLLWVVGTMTVARLLDVDLTWRVVLLIVLSQLLGDFIDFVLEGGGSEAHQAAEPSASVNRCVPPAGLHYRAGVGPLGSVRGREKAIRRG